jgi:glucan biosynthesis protein C
MMQSTDRLHSLDAVRAIALLLGLALHDTLPFLQDVEGWVWTDTPSDIMAAVWYIIHIFRMPLFFLMAGFFGRMIIERKGMKAFIKDRSKRIVIPLFVGFPVVMILCAIAYVIAAILGPVDLMAVIGEAQQEAARRAAAQQETGGFNFSWSYLWFLYYLIIFYTCALAIRIVFNKAIDHKGRIRLALDAIVRFVMRGVWGPVLLALPIAAYCYQSEGWASWTGLPAGFGLSPSAMAMIGYGTVFGLGWLLHRQIHVLLALEKSWALYCVLAVALTVFCYTTAGPAPRWEPYLKGRELLIYSGAYMLCVWCWVYGLVGVSIRFLSNASPVRRYISDASYWIYLMHAPALIFFHVLFGPFDWHWSIKYMLSIAGSMPILLLSYHYMVRFTFIGATLNGRRHPRVQSTVVSSAAVQN